MDANPTPATLVDLDAIRARLAAIERPWLLNDVYPMFTCNNADLLDFVKNAPADVAALVAEIERLRALVDELKLECDYLNEGSTGWREPIDHPRNKPKSG